MKPEHLHYADLEALKARHPELAVDDRVDLAVSELFDIKYPSKKDTKTASEIADFQEELTEGTLDEWGAWVYYPWLNRVVHFPPVEQLRRLRTSRNRNLITVDEQAKLYESTIMICGMSVGSNIVEALVAQGIGSKLILVDMDVIEPTNLNRIRSPFHHIGLHKVEAISRKMWEIDPYIEIVQVNEGLNEISLKHIFAQHKVDVIVDEMDDLRMKIMLREAAKAHRLPLVSAADDGDDALLDVERYDEKDVELFNGRIPKSVLDRIRDKAISRPELGMMIGRHFVGVENIPLRMFRSLAEVGKSLPSWPQLGGAAALSGISIAYVIRKILLGEKIKDGRTLVSIDEKLDLEHLGEAHKAELGKMQRLMRGED